MKRCSLTSKVFWTSFCLAQASGMSATSRQRMTMRREGIAGEEASCAHQHSVRSSTHAWGSPCGTGGRQPVMTLQITCTMSTAVERPHSGERQMLPFLY